MLLLDYQNVLIQSVLTERFVKDAPNVVIDQTISDFDGVIFHISTLDNKTKILVSIRLRCWRDLVNYGAEAVLNREYGDYVVSPESGYDFSVVIDLKNLPEPDVERKDLALKVALMKRNAMAAPFERAMEEGRKLAKEAAKYTSESAPEGLREGGQVMAVHYREEEAIFLKASSDRVTVIFSTVFREETDRVYGEIFMREFIDTRKVPGTGNAPQVLFSKDPPLELQGVPGVNRSGRGEVGYVTFVLFPRHYDHPGVGDKPSEDAEAIISHIQTFRDYFHYHIKASKAYIHTRMRYRTNEFLRVLRRARPDAEEKERKTATGRSFTPRG